MELRDLAGLLAHHGVELAQTELALKGRVIDGIICLEDAAADLDQGISADEGIHDGLEDEGALGLGVVELRGEGLAGLGVGALDALAVGGGQILHDIIEQGVDAADLGAAAHLDGHDGIFQDLVVHSHADLVIRKGVAIEVALHELFAGLRYGFHQGIAVAFHLILAVAGNVALLDFLAGPLEGLLADDVHITGQGAAFVDRKDERRDLLAEALLQSLHDLVIVDIVHIHIGDIDHTGKRELLAQIPGALRTGLDAGLAGHNDDGRVGNIDSLFHFTDKIKVAGSIQDVDLAVLPLDRQKRRADRKSSLLLLLGEVADSVLVLDSAHTGSDTRQVEHGFRESRLAGTAVAEKDDVSDLFRGINLHLPNLQFIYDYCFSANAAE